MAPVSPKTPHARHPSEAAVLNASNLELLATPREETRVQEFVASQTRYARAQANEGRAVRASWDIGTPEKDKMRLHQLSAGFETPVLRPRAVQSNRTEPNHRPAPQPHPNPTASEPTPQPQEPVKKTKSTSAVREAVSPKRQRARANKSGTSNPIRKERRARSDTDEEHLARLTERRERKRVRREIMNPGEVKASKKSEKENKDDAKNSRNEKKKQKLPTGLALMHGFSSTSVGKSRLTIEPPPTFGVFNKGKASAKIKVDQLKRTKQRGYVFSEDRFLNSRPPKSPEEHPLSSEAPSSGTNGNDQPSSPVKMGRSSAVQLRKTPIRIKGTIERHPPAASSQCDNEMTKSHASRSVHERDAKPDDCSAAMSTKVRSPARSASWAIEHDEISLPSTTSVKNKPETALLDIRAAAWSRILKSDLHDEKAPFPPEHHENPRAASILPATTTVLGVDSNAHRGLEELATIGPWESASQVAQITSRPPEPGPVHSRYFASPHADEGISTRLVMHTTNNSPGQLAGIDCELSDNDRDMTIDANLSYGEAGIDHQGGDLSLVSAPANASLEKRTFTFPEEHVSVLQTSSLDSVDRALHSGLPGVARPRSGIRRKSRNWCEFQSTPGNMLFHQYGLDPTDNNCEVSESRPFLHDYDDNELVDVRYPLEDPTALGTMQDSSALNFCGKYCAEGQDRNGEVRAGCSEYYPAVISDPPEFANAVTCIPPNASLDCPNGAQLIMDEDTGHGSAIGREEDYTGVDLSSISSSVFLEGDDDRTTSIHLWNDEAWPRGEAVGGNTLQEGCSRLTTVQKVEQDVAKKLKDHWFPHKF